MARFFGLSFRQAHAADLRLAVSAAGDMVLVHRLVWFAGNARYGNNPFHSSCMRKLRHTSDDIANGVDPLFAGLHPFIGVDKAAFHFYPGRFLQTDALSI